MDTLISKSTFYDTVSMIIPGFITLLALAVICNYDMCVFYKNNPLVIPNYICISAWSYIVGFFIHRVMEFLLRPCLCNNVDCITEIEKKFYQKMDRIKKEMEKKNYKDKDVILHKYYIQYYKSITPNSVPAMEAQVAFIRSMLFVILLCCVAIAKKDYTCNCGGLLNLSTCHIIGILIVIDALLFLMMFYIQDKIYYRVIEDSYYLDLVNIKIPLFDGTYNKTKAEDAANKVKDENNIDKQTNKKQ